MRLIQDALRTIPTTHRILQRDARSLEEVVRPESVHLVLTSPPYWTLLRYRETPGQLGHIEDYETFLAALDVVWAGCLRALVPGGRLVCVVGDVCRSRREHGRHVVVPLHSAIQERWRRLCGRAGELLTPILWAAKSANANDEQGRVGGVYGTPYHPNGIIQSGVEYVLMLRKRGYRRTTLPQRLLSAIAQEDYHRWARQIWTDIPGARRTREHPAPYPRTLAERLIRMCSYVGDTVLDPFLGSGTTTVAAAQCGRDSIGCEVDPHYVDVAERRIDRDLLRDLFCVATTEVVRAPRHGR